MPQPVKFIFPSIITKVSCFVETVMNSILQSNSPNEQEVFLIRTALQEAIVNAIVHGNKKQEELSWEVQIGGGEKVLEIEIKDQGHGFCREKILDPTQGNNLMRTSGRGVYLIEKLMDRVEFLEGGSRIRMSKVLRGTTADSVQPTTER